MNGSLQNASITGTIDLRGRNVPERKSFVKNLSLLLEKAGGRCVTGNSQCCEVQVICPFNDRAVGIFT